MMRDFEQAAHAFALSIARAFSTSEAPVENLRYVASQPIDTGYVIDYAVSHAGTIVQMRIRVEGRATHCSLISVERLTP